MYNNKDKVKEMIEEEFKKLLEKKWSEEERQMIQRIMDGLLYYRKILPRSLKADVIGAIQLCNKLKHQVEILITKVGELEDIAENIQAENTQGFDRTIEDTALE